MATMDDLKKTVEEGVSLAREGVAYAVERAEDLSLHAAVRVRIFALRRRLERAYAELGENVYRLRSRGAEALADGGVKRQLKEITKLEKEIDASFAELERGTRPRAAAQRQTRTTAQRKTRATARSRTRQPKRGKPDRK
ncbi:MAG: hypothetical protein JSU81_07320 [Candidatus Coatesbacteria bacterium]|nr:MAG: hypothetical protein JSU81_07320 [Candidatus Coatesbacteria bacterium]